jgi:hypothetical protein
VRVLKWVLMAWSLLGFLAFTATALFLLAGGLGAMRGVLAIVWAAGYVANAVYLVRCSGSPSAMRGVDQNVPAQFSEGSPR